MTDRFTVYDIFAVLVPGVLISALFVLTMDHLAGVDLIHWTGSVGDATLLLVAGYAVGSFLQALGHLVFSDLGRRRGVRRNIAQALDDESRLLTPQMRVQVLARLQSRFGDLPAVGSAEYSHRLLELTYQAIKEVRIGDPLTDRFQAENHQMRAFVVGFAILSVIALGSVAGRASHECLTYLAVAICYASLSLLSYWRMNDKDRTFVRHVLVSFVNKSDG